MAKDSRLRRLGKRLSLMFRSIGAVFYPRNMKNAFKTVLFSAKEYVCFFVALLLIQAGFITFSLMTDINLSHAKQTIRSEYAHHIEVVGLDQEQKVNLEYTFDLALARKNQYLQSASFYEESPGVYVAELSMHDGVDFSAGLRHVKGEMLSTISQEGWVVRTTPLYGYEADYVVPYTLTFWGVAFLWMILSVAVLWILYRVRVNHFNFVYGIYMACGADFPKLYGTAGGELMAISCLTLLPSILLGGGLICGLHLALGITPTVSARTVVGLLLFNLIAVLLAVYVPMRRMSVKAPVTLLRSLDNGGLVASPRRSFRMFGAGYPVKYELFGMWRMRKYYAGLVLSAVLFASLFVSGLYIADLEAYHDTIDPYEYTVRYGSLKPEGAVEMETDENGEELWPAPVYTDEEISLILGDPDIFLDGVMAVDGVSYVDWSVTTSGGSKLSHLLLKPVQLSGGTDSLVTSNERSDEGYKYAMYEYDYTAFDKTYIDMLVEHELCTFEGDPYRILTEERMVIVSEDTFNERSYHFAPGDKILVAVCDKEGPVQMTFDAKDILRQQIEMCDFHYVEYTVCAVMRGRVSESHITFGVNFDEYTELAGTLPVRDLLKVYMEDGTDFATVQSAEGKIRQAISYCSGWIVEPTGNYFKTHVDGMRQDQTLILTLSILILAVSPLVWFFSQIMYYRKRSREFNLLFALGGQRASIGKLHRLAGGVLSGVAFIITAVLSYICNFVVHLLLNTLLPKFGIIENVHYEFIMSWPALLCCLLTAVVCGFLSCEWPYHLFKKEREKYPDRILVN
ncbi:MAG: hypothetical protein E7661_08650 [Ruminococcaceae bacterium]|nr:hypothetical protein [Oscillospiraceae bacterium]